MSCPGWYSTMDVLRDLQRYDLDLDRVPVLVGEQRPPQQYISDEETELQFLSLRGGCESSLEDMGKPDLAGITQMLRMITNEEQPEHKTTNEMNNNTSLLCISKLNPNVEEFVPRTNEIKSPVKKSDENKAVATILTDKTEDESGDTLNLIKGRIDTNQLTQNEIKEMKDKLKTKISDTSKTACVKVRQQKNLAIATLLRLYSQPSEALEENKQPKLVTPAYYEKLIGNDPTEINSTDPIKKLCIDTKSSDDKIWLIKESKESPLNKCPLHNKSLEKEAHNGHDAKIKEDVCTSDVAASVDKVQQWLRDSEQAQIVRTTPITIVNNGVEEKRNDIQNYPVTTTDKQKSSIYLGPITFKRKASKPMSVSSIDSAERATPKSTPYVPTEYAAELTNAYLERSKANEALKLDMWSKLERELKAKDELKAKEALEKQTLEDS